MNLINRIRNDAMRFDIDAELIPTSCQGFVFNACVKIEMIASANIYKRKDPDGWIADLVIDPRMERALGISAIGIPDHMPLPTRRLAYTYAVALYAALLRQEAEREAKAA